MVANRFTINMNNFAKALGSLLSFQSFGSVKFETSLLQKSKKVSQQQEDPTDPKDKKDSKDSKDPKD